ncbi:AMP-binding protein [Microbacterium sp. CFH 31415]|uniref:AMP-binding protein n=1 Tax=Microbacterium sp. CFH 31415 TaxID=2921732 RepID=UPI001F12F756|nr:AMP-binding protein [Microbacterium sp. CFH 31415]MCH6231628.1 AMP-binding protein [Microbacterium sp. CFH 31415]
MRTFAEVVRSRAGDMHEGLRFEGRIWTWAEVIDEAAARAAFLRTLEPGEGRSQVHVGILLQNVPDFVFWLLAAALSGSVAVGVNPTRRGAELAHDISHSDCDLLISTPLYLEVDRDVIPLPDDRILDVESEEYKAMFADAAGTPLPDEIPGPGLMYLLLFSSGSTGAPKAVICTQGRLGRLTEAMSARVDLHRESVNYMCLPLFHGHAIMMNLATAAEVGATVVMVRKFSASRFASDIRAHGVTYFNYVGRVLSYVLAHPERPEDAENRLEVAFGSEAGPAEAVEFRRRFGCDVREGYGASEGVIRIVPTPDSPPGALGVPVAGLTAEIRRAEDDTECPRARFDEQGRLLNAEEATGEIVVIGAGPRFEGYYKNPEAMAERLRFGGLDFWTGDLAYRDERGFFWFAGRSSDWLRVDGENFGTAPVERIISRFPPVSGAHAYAVPDPRNGDQLMVAIVLHPGAEFSAEAFADFLAEQPDLGTKWRPTFVRVLSVAPTTANGKVDKAPLRRDAWEAGDVWWAASRTSPYVLLDDAQRAAFRQDFVDAGRENALPQSSRDILWAKAPA